MTRGRAGNGKKGWRNVAAVLVGSVGLIWTAQPWIARAGDPEPLKARSIDLYFERCAELTDAARKLAAVQWDNLVAMGNTPERIYDVAQSLPEDCVYISFNSAIMAWGRERDLPPLRPVGAGSYEKPWKQQGYSAGSASPPALGDPPLTNDDVLRMHSAGLSSSVIAAKVLQAPNVAFDLEVDTLLQLKEAELPDAVVEAMLQAGGGEEAAETEDGGDSAVPQAGHLRVWLDADDRAVELRPQAGRVEEGGRSLKVVFDGVSAGFKTTDTAPRLHLAYPVDPTGLVYISEVEVDSFDNERWCGVQNPMSYLSWKEIPIPDDEIRFDVKLEEPGLWQLTLRDGLHRSDQYALWAAATSERGLVLQVFDFEVRPK